MGDTDLWDQGHNGVGSAALVYDACQAGQGSQVCCSRVCSLPKAQGVHAEGLDGPRLAPDIGIKCFLYLISRGAGQDVYTSFANFKGGGTNSPNIPSLVLV